MKTILGTVAFLALVACNNAGPAPTGSTAAPISSSAGRRTRATPVCATQDCATKKIIDDGCASDGRCAACVNPCP